MIRQPENRPFVSRNVDREATEVLDLQELCDRHRINVKSVIHVGAHEGKVIAQYQKMQLQGVLLIEANPIAFERLETKLEGIANMVAIEGAISDRTGTTSLFVTAPDQFSSILPPHISYSDVSVVEQIEVPCSTLDALFEEFELDPKEFNLLSLDIQGSELLALKGSQNLLNFIQVVYTQVNYKERYEGCALIHEIDRFLDDYGFERLRTTHYEASWGYAFYVKKSVITMSTLGNNGRFANQLFQYAFLKIYAKTHNLRVETSPWIGQFLFGHSDAIVSQALPVVGSPEDLLPDLAEFLTSNHKAPYQNVEFWGYFQYHTRYYAPHRAYIRTLFEPTFAIKHRMQEGVSRLKKRGKIIVGIHLRRGDYGYGYFFISPTRWYLDWLKGFWKTLEEPVLFIASDEPKKVLADFAEYHPITTKDLAIDLPEAPFYPDFYLLSQCDVLAISNSCFSFAACLLNDRAKAFFRPHLLAQKLIPFDPWNSEPLLRNAIIQNEPDA